MRFPSMNYAQFRRWLGLRNVIHIAPDCSDENPGTRKRPIQTYAHAISIMGKNDVIKFGCGAYGDKVDKPEPRTDIE